MFAYSIVTMYDTVIVLPYVLCTVYYICLVCQEPN